VATLAAGDIKDTGADRETKQLNETGDVSAIFGGREDWLIFLEILLVEVTLPPVSRSAVDWRLS
jgi:hypothetical protein